MYPLLSVYSLALNRSYRQSAFSDKLGPYGHDVYQMLVPDVMHEVELGVWKAVFKHLVRVLIAAGGDGVQRLDQRYVSAIRCSCASAHALAASRASPLLVATPYADLDQTSPP